MDNQECLKNLEHIFAGLDNATARMEGFADDAARQAFIDEESDEDTADRMETLVEGMSPEDKRLHACLYDLMVEVEQAILRLKPVRQPILRLWLDEERTPFDFIDSIRELSGNRILDEETTVLLIESLRYVEVLGPSGMLSSRPPFGYKPH